MTNENEYIFKKLGFDRSEDRFQLIMPYKYRMSVKDLLGIDINM